MKNEKKSSSAQASTKIEMDLHEAFAKTAQDRANGDLARRALFPLDAANAARFIRAAIERVSAIESDLREALPHNAPDLVRLKTLADATIHSVVLEQSASEERPEIGTRRLAALARLDLLGSDAMAAARRGLVPIDTVQRLTSDRNASLFTLATTTLALVKVLTDSFESLRNRSAITEDELEKLAAASKEDLDALDAPEKSPAREAAVEQRVRATIAAADAYEHLRRAVTYTRWFEGDAETFAPSLFKANRLTAKKRDESAPEDEHETVTREGAPVRATTSQNDEESDDVPQNHPFAE
jgi:hypothetical protein